MITKEVNDWIKKVERGHYTSWDIMEEFAQMAKHLTKAEMKQIAEKLKNFEFFKKQVK